MPRLKTTRTEAEVGDLLLDLENPRTGAVGGQAEALEAIIKLNGQHFRNMMLSIKDNDLDPGDSFYVIVDDDDQNSYVVVDGNRRLAALKVLNNPVLLDGTKLGDSVKKRLRDAAGLFAPIEPINCVVFDSREDANEWIERRHGKGLEGEGRISWGTLESERFQRIGQSLTSLASLSATRGSKKQTGSGSEKASRRTLRRSAAFWCQRRVSKRWASSRGTTLMDQDSSETRDTSSRF